MSMNQNWTNNTEDKKVEAEKPSTSSMTSRLGSSVAGQTSSNTTKETGTNTAKQTGSDTAKYTGFNTTKQTGSATTKQTGSEVTKETDSSQEEDKKKKKGVFIAIAAAAALLLLGIGGFGVYSMVKKNNAAAVERDNTMSLIQRYLDRGEYDRALDLLEDLLIKNANDAEALALLEDAMALMALKNGSDDSSIEEIIRKLTESGALGGIEGLDGINGLEDLRALIEAANRNNATMNEILRQQQSQGKAGAGAAGNAGTGTASGSGSGAGLNKPGKKHLEESYQ